MSFNPDLYVGFGDPNQIQKARDNLAKSGGTSHFDQPIPKPAPAAAPKPKPEPKAEVKQKYVHVHKKVSGGYFDSNGYFYGDDGTILDSAGKHDPKSATKPSAVKQDTGSGTPDYPFDESGGFTGPESDMTTSGKDSPPSFGSGAPTDTTGLFPGQAPKPAAPTSPLAIDFPVPSSPEPAKVPDFTGVVDGPVAGNTADRDETSSRPSIFGDLEVSDGPSGGVRPIIGPQLPPVTPVTPTRPTSPLAIDFPVPQAPKPPVTPASGPRPNDPSNSGNGTYGTESNPSIFGDLEVSDGPSGGVRPIIGPQLPPVTPVTPTRPTSPLAIDFPVPSSPEPAKVPDFTGVVDGPVAGNTAHGDRPQAPAPSITPAMDPRPNDSSSFGTGPSDPTLVTAGARGSGRAPRGLGRTPDVVPGIPAVDDFYSVSGDNPAALSMNEALADTEMLESLPIGHPLRIAAGLDIGVDSSSDIDGIQNAQQNAALLELEHSGESFREATPVTYQDGLTAAELAERATVRTAESQVPVSMDYYDFRDTTNYFVNSPDIADADREAAYNEFVDEFLAIQGQGPETETPLRNWNAQVLLHDTEISAAREAFRQDIAAQGIDPGLQSAGSYVNYSRVLAEHVNEDGFNIELAVEQAHQDSQGDTGFEKLAVRELVTQAVIEDKIDPRTAGQIIETNPVIEDKEWGHQGVLADALHEGTYDLEQALEYIRSNIGSSQDQIHLANFAVNAKYKIGDVGYDEAHQLVNEFEASLGEDLPIRGRKKSTAGQGIVRKADERISGNLGSAGGATTSLSELDKTRGINFGRRTSYSGRAESARLPGRIRSSGFDVGNGS